MKVLLRLTRLYAPYWRWMAGGALLALVVVLANVALMGVSGWFLASMAAAGIAGTTMNYFTPAAAVRAFAILRTGGRYAERLVTHEATFRFLSGLRVWFYRCIEPLPVATLQQYRGGDLLSRMGADIDALQNFYLRTLVPMVVATAASLAIFIFLGLYSAAVAWLDLGALILVGVAVPAIVHRLGKGPGARMVETAAALRVGVVDSVQGMGELIVFGAADARRESIAALSRQLVAEQDRMSRLSGFGTATAGLITHLSLWLTAVLAIGLVRADQVPAVDLPMLVLVVMASFEAVVGLPQAYQYLGHTLTAARRIFAVADTPLAMQEPEQPAPPPTDFGVRFEQVSLRYGSDAPWALAKVDLAMGQGRRLALVGSTGSGKSTVAGALLRLWEYEVGRITLGGRDLRDYRTEDVRDVIALAPQHSHLFNTTVRENLRLASPDADDAALIAACTVAQIHDEIAALPDGYDTYVGEAGARFSGGQVRRIAIARALLRNAPITILDEPTEGLDAATEERLMQALFEATAGRTLVIITHRPAGLDRMDEIAVMENGRIVEQGTHEVLSRDGARYRRLYFALD